jgi:flavorubredoxin
LSTGGGCLRESSLAFGFIPDRRAGIVSAEEGSSVNTRIVEGIDWVGCIDWAVRDFHGYRTDRGSTYNAYLVRGEKTALVDTVKAPFAGALLANVRELADPAGIHYLVCNHAEPDHAGSLPVLVKNCPRAEVVCDAKCRDALSAHVDTSGWRFRIVSSGDELSLGGLTLRFIETPMVHWPESMFTYVPERKVLFSMDAFGQHYASSGRFDDQEPFETLMDEAKTYYANIVMLYSVPIARALEHAGGLEMDVIAPSHGVMWRKRIPDILAAYKRWVSHKVEPKVLVAYDTMWQSTAAMAEAIAAGVMEGGARVRLVNVRNDALTALATEALDAAVLAVGSPTLNRTLMPQVAAALTYLKGLQPVGKSGMAFGSYGWTMGGAKAVEDALREMKVEILCDVLQCRYVPGPEALAECRAAGRLMAECALRKAGGGGPAARPT